MNGSVTKSKNKYRYVIEIGIDSKTGKRKQVTKSGFKTKTEAKSAMRKKMLEIEGEVTQGINLDYTNITVKDYLIEWLDKSKSNITAKTYSQYSYIVNKALIPNIGAIKLKSLNPLQIQNFYHEQLSRDDLSSTTVRHFHIVLHKALSQAVNWRILLNNPSDSVEKPKKRKTEMQVYTDAQVVKLLENLKYKSIYYPVLIAVTTGLRAAEICGLRWDDINFDAREIYVTKQLQRVDDNLELVDLKTSKSKRKIPLLDITFTALLELQDIYNKNMLENAEYFHDYKFVICNIDGTPYAPDYISRNYNRTMKEYKNKDGKNLCEQLNINYIRFHDLRHTHATSLLKQGTNPKIVAERLGHSSITITLDTYSHVLPGMQKEAIEKLNSLYILE